MLDHSVQASTKRAAAGRTLAIFTERDDTIALVFELRVLLPQCLALRLRFLSIAHPLGATRLEQALRVLQLGALFLELEGRFLFQSGSALDPRVTLLETRNLLAQRCVRFEQSFPAPLFAIECVERLELDV